MMSGSMSGGEGGGVGTTAAAREAARLLSPHRLALEMAKSTASSLRSISNASTSTSSSSIWRLD